MKYEEIVETVQSIKDEDLRKFVIAELMEGDIQGLQELYAMKKHSTSPYNTADGVFDQRTLTRMQDPLFGLYEDSLINSKLIPKDLKEVYKNFVDSIYNNQ